MTHWFSGLELTEKYIFPFLLILDMVYSHLAIDPAFREFGERDDHRLNK